ncbi:hypothetical protein HanPSC8_Chr14g0642541 [Helianthus annuus]|nr:hypothetical protein HanPSC8_Chr14g0642541 [Helianthus annuus]
MSSLRSMNKEDDGFPTFSNSPRFGGGSGTRFVPLVHIYQELVEL